MSGTCLPLSADLVSRNSFALCLCIAAERENSQLLRPSDVVNSEAEDFDNGLQLVCMLSLHVASKCLSQWLKEFTVMLALSTGLNCFQRRAGFKMPDLANKLC